MNDELKTPPGEALALARFALIAKIQDLLRQGFPLSLALEQVSICPLSLPDGSQRLFARRTLEDWWYDYQHSGFAGLIPQTRADKGQARRLTPEQQKWILEQAQAHLGVPLKVLYRRWKEQDPTLPSLNTVYRFLREHELSTKTRRQLLKQPLGGATKCFEAPFVNDLWMVDFSPGPFLHPPGQAKALATQLCVIIDDHSRLIPYAGYFLQADTQAFHQTLKEAIRRRGLPAKLYTDQGGPFVNDHTGIVCARLGIRLLHAKPYHAWSKEKASYCTSLARCRIGYRQFQLGPLFDLFDHCRRGTFVHVFMLIIQWNSFEHPSLTPIVHQRGSSPNDRGNRVRGQQTSFLEPLLTGFDLAVSA
jgi:transposase InsO family protein